MMIRLTQITRRLLLMAVLGQFILSTVLIQRYRQKNKRDNHFSLQPVPDSAFDISSLNISIMNVHVPEKNAFECAKQFLLKYREYCEEMTSARVNITGETIRNFCPCVPAALRGLTNLSLKSVTLVDLEVKHWDLMPGGRWYPTGCTARQKIAVLIPFFNRHQHLRLLLDNLHSILRRQLLDYTIFVIEQTLPMTIFNKGALMNAGFIETRARGPFDCYIFHDVDMLLEDDRNMYTCSKTIRHLGAFILKYYYWPVHGVTIGGVSAFTRKQYELLNGFSNECYGWGGEDDDMSFRMEIKKQPYIRFPRCVSQYTMVSHGRDYKNPQGPCTRGYVIEHANEYEAIGLNSVKYKLIEERKHKLHTTLLVDIPPVPVRKTTTKTTTTTTTTTNSSYNLV